MRRQDIKYKLEKIQKIFDIDKILKIKTDKKYIQRYYDTNEVPYSIFHTNTGFVHMGISRDGKYKEDDLFEAARIVEKYLRKTAAHNVLELATGRGANSIYLAKTFPDVTFYGIDISKSNLRIASKKSGTVKNYHPSFGDFHNLKRFKNKKFDVVFVIEALCHSNRKEKVLSEVHRVLKDDGIFIIFDAYSSKNIKKMTPEQKIALQLTARGVAVKRFENYKEFISKARKVKFETMCEENVSNFIVPSTDRFERKSSLFFKFPILAKILSVIFPKEFVYNVIFGYLGTTLIKAGLCCYMITVLKKI